MDASSYAQLVALVEELSALNAEQATRIDQQAARIAVVTEQGAAQAERIAKLELGQNFENSSLPPSSDRFGKSKSESLRGKTGCKPGKQSDEASQISHDDVLRAADLHVQQLPDVTVGVLEASAVNGAFLQSRLPRVPARFKSLRNRLVDLLPIVGRQAGEDLCRPLRR